MWGGEMVVRRADGGDVAALAGLRRAWAEEVAGRTVADDGFADAFAEWYFAEAGRRVGFLAEVDGVPVGMTNLVLFERMPVPGRAVSRWGYLANAFVLAGYRNRGVGSALLRAVLGHADGLGCVRVVLSPTERSVPFYRRAGFGPADMLLARVQDDPA